MEPESKQQKDRAAELIPRYYAVNLPEGTMACKLKRVSFLFPHYVSQSVEPNGEEDKGNES